MPVEQFIDRNFSAGSLTIIRQANDIIRSYRKRGFTLTLRQLYYQFVSKDLLQNKQTEYKRLGSIINDARLAGLIDWTAIEDRTRNVRRVSQWESPAEIIEAISEQYREDRWEGQDSRVEVWIEKDALIGVIEKVCEERLVPYFSCRGSVSQSEMYAAGKRFESLIGDGIRPIVLHLGDHDPSGVDMTRDNTERLAMFARDGVEVRRLALNMPQIRKYRPPPNPAKESDSRAAGYIERFGESSWELDALSPEVIAELISDELDGIIDPVVWQEREGAEDERRALLVKVSENWDDVVEFLREKD